MILHLGLPSGQWLRVTPNEAREMGRARRQKVGDAMRKTLTSSQSLDQSLLDEAAAKAFAIGSAGSAGVAGSSPLTGANTVPVTSTPNRSIGAEDVLMNEANPSPPGRDF